MTKQKTLEHLADEIAPVVTEYIQETIAWQTDGNEYAESLTANEYLEPIFLAALASNSLT